jgi:hypothetical protein
MAKTYIALDPRHRFRLPRKFQDNDVRFPESVAKYFIKEFTRRGAVVLDPFAGFGTTLRVAEQLGRLGYGVELDDERRSFAQGNLRHPERLLAGDSRKLAALQLPPADFVLTSPPYRPDAVGTRGRLDGRGYRAYLQEMRSIFQLVARKMKHGAYAVVKVSNLRHRGRVQPLAWDLAAALGEVLRFEGERVLLWERERAGFNHSYALIFRHIEL